MIKNYYKFITLSLLFIAETNLIKASIDTSTISDSIQSTLSTAQEKASTICSDFYTQSKTIASAALDKSTELIQQGLIGTASTTLNLIGTERIFSTLAGFSAQETKESLEIFKNLQKISNGNLSNWETANTIISILGTKTGQKLVNAANQCINVAEGSIPFLTAINDFKTNPCILTACKVLRTPYISTEHLCKTKDTIPNALNIASVGLALKNASKEGINLDVYKENRQNHKNYYKYLKWGLTSAAGGCAMALLKYYSYYAYDYYLNHI